jgi:hypothetical protein
MDGAAKAAVHVGDWKFTTLFREVGLATMLKKISSPSAGNVIARSIRNEERSSERFSSHVVSQVFPPYLP